MDDSYARWQFYGRAAFAALVAYLAGYFASDWITATYGNDGLITAVRMIATGAMR